MFTQEEEQKILTTFANSPVTVNKLLAHVLAKLSTFETNISAIQSSVKSSIKEIREVKSSVESSIKEIREVKSSIESSFKEIREVKSLFKEIREVKSSVEDLKYFARNRLTVLRSSCSEILIEGKAIASCYPVLPILDQVHACFISVKHWANGITAGARVEIRQGSALFKVKRVLVFKEIDATVLEIEDGVPVLDPFCGNLIAANVGDRLVYYSKVPAEEGGEGQCYRIKSIGDIEVCLMTANAQPVNSGSVVTNGVGYIGRFGRVQQTKQ